jgi:predicted O-linked N-acetylglucosamine transferase (SPINDLY family)
LQLHWLGYLGTLGAEHVDYIVTDAYATPPDEQRHFSERFLYLPNSYCPSDTRREVAATPSREACALPPQGFVFCSFNNPYKLLPDVFDVWARLLQAVPGSVLWVAPTSAAACANLQREADRRGVDPTRIVFAPRVTPSEHLARHRHADLYLDTMPYNAGTAANDALLMGVPVVTCSGTTMASRVAGSQLRAIGLDDLVTTGLDAYEARAMTLARDREALEDAKQRLARNRSTHPLFDMQRFTRDFERALLYAWESKTQRPP